MLDDTAPAARIMAVTREDAIDLEQAGIVELLPRLRGPILDTALQIGTDAAVVVTLLQAPDTLARLITWIRNRSTASDAGIDITARRGTRRVTLHVNAEIPVETVTSFLNDALSTDDQVPPG